MLSRAGLMQHPRRRVALPGPAAQPQPSSDTQTRCGLVFLEVLLARLSLHLKMSCLERGSWGSCCSSAGSSLSLCPLRGPIFWKSNLASGCTTAFCTLVTKPSGSFRLALLSSELSFPAFCGSYKLHHHGTLCLFPG